jgi:hypothetical protein
MGIRKTYGNVSSEYLDTGILGADGRIILELRK